jgi:hypothetical protein
VILAEVVMRESRLRFIQQLGYSTPASDTLYTALMVQPRLVGGIVAIGILFQSAWLFLALAAGLGLGAMVPAMNLSDAIYNAIARARGLPPLGLSPAPRRFAMGMAAGALSAIAAALLAGAAITAGVLEGLVAISVTAVIFGDYCGPATLYFGLRRLTT